MLPIALDLSRLPIALIGNGQGLIKRMEKLDSAGIEDISVYSQDASLLQHSIFTRHKTNSYLPKEEDLSSTHVLMGVDLDETYEEWLYDYARTHRILINIEDRMPYCDFHFSSVVRRGDLMLSVNSKGKSPALTARIARLLEAAFEPLWAERLEAIAEKRLAWKKEGLGFKDIIKNSNQWIDEQGWFGDNLCPRHRMESKRP